MWKPELLPEFLARQVKAILPKKRRALPGLQLVTGPCVHVGRREGTRPLLLRFTASPEVDLRGPPVLQVEEAGRQEHSKRGH